MVIKKTTKPKRPLWCERCHALIYRIWKTSWFTDEEICIACADKEDEIKAKLVKAGKNPTDYEGCGYLPEV